MKYRRLGRAGLQVSELSLGSWVTFANQVDTNHAKELMACAYDAGVNFFDNAEGYESGKSEEAMGDALHALNWSRDSYCVSSKVFWGGNKPTQRGLSAKHVTEACHAAMKRLRVDYLDLYFCHRPDIDTPIEETVRAMHNLITQGKVLYWGTSQWSAQQITEAHLVARQYGLTPPTMEQPIYNMFDRELVDGEYRSVFENLGLGTTIFSPLSSGLLTGKYSQGIPDDSRLSLPGYEWLRDVMYDSEGGKAKLEKVAKLQTIADELDMPLAHLAYAFCLRNKNVSSVIVGASKLEQLKNNLKSIDNLERVPEDVWSQVENILDNKPGELERF